MFKVKDSATQKKTLARCGHDDLLGYFTNTPCAKCVRKAHRKVVNSK
jgi:hypothetical protein